MNLAAIPDARRTKRDFPRVNQRAINRDGKKKIGFADIVVVEEIIRAGLKCVGIQRPAAEGNRDAELVLFVALAVQRHERKIRVVGEQ